MTEPTSPTAPTGNDPIAAGQMDKANGTTMVVIGCKLPNGMLMELGVPGDDEYTQVRLNGSNATVEGSLVSGTGYGLTMVSRSFWERWLNGTDEKNTDAKGRTYRVEPGHKRMAFVRNALVFEHNDMASARDHAKDLSEVRSGFEALDPERSIQGRGPQGEIVVAETDKVHLEAGKAAVQEATRAHAAKRSGGRRAA